MLEYVRRLLLAQTRLAAQFDTAPQPEIREIALRAERETGDAPPVAEKASPFRGRPRFPGAKRTETGWADGVFLLHAWQKDFFDTLKASVNFF